MSSAKGMRKSVAGSKISHAGKRKSDRGKRSTRGRRSARGRDQPEVGDQPVVEGMGDHPQIGGDSPQ